MFLEFLNLCFNFVCKVNTVRNKTFLLSDKYYLITMHKKVIFLVKLLLVPMLNNKLKLCIKEPNLSEFCSQQVINLTEISFVNDVTHIII